MDNGAHRTTSNQSIGTGSSAQVTPQERAAAVAKLYIPYPWAGRDRSHSCRQTFLMAVVGPGEDALLKAAELANKFEHHVFASTTNKEEYLRVIITRMQQVQQRRKSLSTSTSVPFAVPPSFDPMHKPPTPSSNPATGAVPSGMGPPMPPAALGSNVGTTVGIARLTDTEKVLVRQKLGKLAFLLPKLDTLLREDQYRSSLTSHVLRQLQTIKSLVERQISLLETNTFIISSEATTSMFGQLQGILRQHGLLEDIPDRERLATANGDIEEQRLLSWLRSNLPRSHDMTPANQLHLYDVPLWREQEWVPEREQLRRTRAILSEEIHWLTKHLKGTNIISQAEPWGYDLLVSLETRRGQTAQVSVQLPLAYPSDRLYLRSIFGVDSVIHDIHQGSLRLFTPISLTTVIRIIRHAMLGDETTGN